MQSMLKEATTLLQRVVQLDPDVKMKSEIITKKIVEDHIMIDLEDKTEGEAELMTVDDEMVQMMPQHELSMFSN